MNCPHCNRQLVLGLVTWDCPDHGPIQDIQTVTKIVAVLPIPQMQIDEFFRSLAFQTLFGEDSELSEGSEEDPSEWLEGLS